MRAAHRALIAAMLLTAGCYGMRPDRPELFPVTGHVEVDGKPVAGVLVGFHPAAGSGLQARRSFGQTKDDGSFAMTTFNPGDGVPPGTYRVTLIWAPPSPIGDPTPDRFRGRYNNPQQPFTTVTVERGENQLEPFRVKTR